MAIPSQDCQASDSEREASHLELPRKASFTELLARYLRMGFLSCFGISGANPQQNTNINIEEEKYGALQRQMSRPLEVPQDDVTGSKEEPYAQIVESYGPENSVPASFRTGFLGAEFDNEFSLTNGVKWQVWDKPGELSEGAIAHFQTRSDNHSMGDTPTAPISPEINPSFSPLSEPSPDLSPRVSTNHRGTNPLEDFQLPPGIAWDGWGERLGEEKGAGQGSTSNDENFSTDGGFGQPAESAKSLRTGEGSVLDTSDGAALLSKLGTPHTIPLTPEIEEELRRSVELSPLQGPVALSRDVSIGSPFSTPGSEAAGFHPERTVDRLFRSSSSPSTRTKIGDELNSVGMQQGGDVSGAKGDVNGPGGDISGAVGGRGVDISGRGGDVSGPKGDVIGPDDDVSGQGSDISSPGNNIRPPAPLTKSRSVTIARVKTPLRTQSLRSQGSFKIVKETHQIKEGEDIDGHKTVNQYVKLRRIGTGSYGKVVLHKDRVTGKLCAMKILHRSRLMHVRISGEETAWTDVLRETAIMKQLDHPNLVSLQEVIDDPDNDKMYMVLEYEEKGPVFEGTGPEGGIGEERARAYMRDVLAGLQYLHYYNIVHGDIKPDNLLMSADGRIKIGDFGVSHIFENENDQLRRTPGTPAFTAPECCLGKPYHGKPADMWALGCTLYVFVTGRYPFMTESRALEDLYQAILHQELAIPPHLHPDLQDLLRKLLEKDPAKRVTAEEAAKHPWLTADLGPLPQVELRAIDVGADQLQAAMTQLDDASKGRLARLFARHAAALRRKKATAAEDDTNQENAVLSRTSSIKSTDAYDSDFSAPSSRYGSPKRESASTQSPPRVRSSRFSSSERSLNPAADADRPD